MAASISAPRAARPAGAATSRTRSTPSADWSSGVSAASQTIPSRATVAPRASSTEASSSGSSERLRSALPRAILIHLVQELPVQLLHRVVPLPSHVEGRAQLAELLLQILLSLGARPDAEDLVLEGARLRVGAQHHVQVSDDRAEEIDLLVHDLEDVGLDRVSRAEVVDPHVLGLPQAVQAPDPLLDPHRIPGQVVVHEVVAELEIASLPARLGADQHPGPLAELLDRGLLLAQGEGAVEDRHLDAEMAEGAREVFQRGA